MIAYIKNYIIYMVERMNSIYNFRFIVYYIKVHCIQAPFEAFMALFLYVWGIFLYGSIEIDKSVIILNSLYTALVVCMVYLIVINIAFLRCIYTSIKLYLQDPIDYNRIERRLKRLSQGIHIAGVLCYTFVTYEVLLKTYGDNFYLEDDRKVLLAIGVLVGIIWNIRGYWGDLRIDWRKINKNLNSYEYKSDYEKVRREKLMHTMLHITINILTIIVMVIVYVLYTLNSKEYILSLTLQPTSMTIGEDGFYIVAFICLLYFYIKTLYPLYYVQKGSIYYSFVDLFPEGKWNKTS